MTSLLDRKPPSNTNDNSTISQIGQATRDLIQVGGNFTQYTINNFSKKRWVVVFLNIVFILVFMFASYSIIAIFQVNNNSNQSKTEIENNFNKLIENNFNKVNVSLNTFELEIQGQITLLKNVQEQLDTIQVQILRIGQNNSGISGGMGEMPTSTSTSTSQKKADLIRRMQKILKQQKYLPSKYKPTGFHDSATKKAVEKVQREKGLPITGRIDETTQSAIEMLEGFIK